MSDRGSPQPENGEGALRQAPPKSDKRFAEHVPSPASASKPRKPSESGKRHEMRARDISDQAHSMPRNSAILYRNRRPKSNDSPAYAGVLRMADGRKFWALIWPRAVNGKAVVELKLTEKSEDSPDNG